MSDLPEPEPKRPPMVLMQFRYDGGPCDGLICGPVRWPESYLESDAQLCIEVTQKGRTEGLYRIRRDDKSAFQMSAVHVPSDQDVFLP